MPCIGVVMLKSKRMVGALLVDGVVGLDFDAWGCTWLLWRDFSQPFEMLVYVSIDPDAYLGR
jgi:hypothetical protein